MAWRSTAQTWPTHPFHQCGIKPTGCRIPPGATCKFPNLVAVIWPLYWTLAFFSALRWLTQKASEDWQIIGQFRRFLTGHLQEGSGMFVTMVTHHVGHRTHAFLGVSMVHAPLHKRQGDQNHGAPLFRRFGRLHPKIGPAPRLFDIEVVHCNGPALLRDRQGFRG